VKKFLFILGRNWRLALSEIDIYLQTKAYQGKILDYSASVAIVEFEQDKTAELIADLMDRLGLVQKIGYQIDFISKDILQQAFPEDIEANRQMIYTNRQYIDNTLKDVVYEVFGDPKGKKIFIANSIYPIEFSDPYYKILLQHFLQYLNKYYNTYLKDQGAKQALYFKYPQKQIEEGTLNPIFPNHFYAYHLYEPDRAEILYCQTEEGMYVGKTITVVDSNFQKEMDETRPFSDYRQTIPPKFAKYLLSLLGLSEPLEQKKILDPFCGTGTILMFAFCEGIQIYGADFDMGQVTGSRKNIIFTSQKVQQKLPKDFIETHIQHCKIEQINNLFPSNSFDGIVSEPVLLPFYREKPTFDTVQQELDNSVLPIYKIFLEKAYELLKPGHRIALVSPIIQTQEDRRVNLPILSYGRNAGFEPIPLIRPSRVINKEKESLNLHAENNFTFFDAGTERIIREFFLFEKSGKKTR
jgi:tRNA G10  N-methylase Trm11